MTFDPLRQALPGVQALEPYQPGKPNETIERELGIRKIVKLASNENPRTPQSVMDAIYKEAGDTVSRYPDGSGHALKAVSYTHLTLPTILLV